MYIIGVRDGTGLTVEVSGLYRYEGYHIRGAYTTTRTTPLFGLATCSVARSKRLLPSLIYELGIFVLLHLQLPRGEDLKRFEPQVRFVSHYILSYTQNLLNGTLLCWISLGKLFSTHVEDNCLFSCRAPNVVGIIHSSEGRGR